MKRTIEGDLEKLGKSGEYLVAEPLRRAMERRGIRLDLHIEAIPVQLEQLDAKARRRELENVLDAVEAELPRLDEEPAIFISLRSTHAEVVYVPKAYGFRSVIVSRTREGQEPFVWVRNPSTWFNGPGGRVREVLASKERDLPKYADQYTERWALLVTSDSYASGLREEDVANVRVDSSFDAVAVYCEASTAHPAWAHWVKPPMDHRSR